MKVDRRLVLARMPGVEVLAGEDGRALVGVEGKVKEVPGLRAAELRSLLGVVDGRRSVAQVVELLGSRFEEEDVCSVLAALLGRVLAVVPPEGAEGELSAFEAAAEARALPSLFVQAPPERTEPGAIRTVGILGGGSAGYLAALLLKAKLPALGVTLIESSEIPIIGVGEATTPLLPALLHGTLGLDMADFFAAVRPTFKLGIRFLWGQPAPYGFSYPFTAGRLEEAIAYDGHVDTYSIFSLLMAADRVPLVVLGDGDVAVLPGPFAYHVDNRRFVAYLREAAKRAGVQVLDRRVVDADLVDTGDSDGPHVAHLLTADGQRLGFDFFLDASGFRSCLLGEKLGSPFLSYSTSLFTDAALAADHPHGGLLRPYTVAETFDAGWTWSLAQRESDHRGYVFSTAHRSPDEAAAELQRSYPAIGEPRLVHFRCGRRRESWRGNVVAIGNASGFVEPLESTALHMVVVTLVQLIKQLPVAAPEPAARERFNLEIGRQWDELRWFLALHFRFNQRLDTPFWRDCRASVDISGADGILGLYRERGLLSVRPHGLRFDDLWGDFGRDLILAGQAVPAPTPQPRLPRDQWRRLVARGRALAARAATQGVALRMLEEQPELLARLGRAPWLSDAAVGGRPGW